jgi:hypothetical protein
MTRPYEMPLYPLPPVLGIVLNLVLTAVLVRFLIRTDPLALGLSAAWILLGVVVYVALERLGPAGGVGTETATEPTAANTTDGSQPTGGPDVRPGDEDD